MKNFSVGANSFLSEWTTSPRYMIFLYAFLILYGVVAF